MGVVVLPRRDHDPVAWLAVATGALLFGVASGVIPVINAEAFLAATAAASALPLAATAAVAVGVGQTAGKLAVFLAARRGASWRLPGRRRRGSEPPGPSRSRPPGPVRRRLAELGRRGLALLDRPLLGGGVILASAAVGIPPLAVTTVAAGLSRMRPLLFAVTVLVGRTGWFLLITLASDRLAGGLLGR
jgi:membrane protein YqaA with SNARE-associated domain